MSLILCTVKVRSRLCFALKSLFISNVYCGGLFLEWFIENIAALRGESVL